MSAIAQYMPTLFSVIVLLGLSGYFSGSETALFSLSRAEAKRMEAGSRGERAASRLLRSPQSLLSTLLVGNMFVNILLTSVSASLLAKMVTAQGTVSTLLNILVVTPLLMIFGELTPKTIACNHAPAFSRRCAIPLRMFSYAIVPARWMLRWSTGMVLSILGQRDARAWEMLTQDEVTAMLAAGMATGATDERESELLKHILRLGTIAAHDIMVPRTEVVGVSDRMTLAEAYEKAKEVRHSRLPVYEEDLDGIWGVIAAVDLPRWRGTAMMDCPLAEMREEMESDGTGSQLPVYPVSVVPESVKVERLLTQMRESRAHFAVLVGEYGGTAGILTMNDILEEVVGQISPSEGPEEREFVVVDDTILLDGKLHIRELGEELGIELTTNGTDTVGGYVMERLGRLPRTGDQVQSEGYQFEVVKMVGRRIGAMRITPAPAAQEEGDTE